MKYVQIMSKMEKSFAILDVVFQSSGLTRQYSIVEKILSFREICVQVK